MFPEGPVSQIHSRHLLVGAHGIFSDLLRFVQMLKRERERERERGMWKETGSYRTYSSLVKLHPGFLSLQWKTCLCAELQTWCLSFTVKVLPLSRTLMIYIYIYRFSNPSVTLPTSQLILQPFRCFSYVTAHSPTLLSLLLPHSIFTYVTWRAAHVLHSMRVIWMTEPSNMTPTTSEGF